MAKILRRIVEIDEELCDGCGQCVPACAEGAIQIINGKARLVAEPLCDGLGACLGHCPRGAIKLIEREAAPFDEKMVEAFQAQQKAKACPGTQARFFGPSKHKGALSHWPIQIRLVPPQAPFLKERPLLIAADCVGFSYPDFHQKLLAGQNLLIGCPKFDDPEAYFLKFKEIFAANPVKALTVAIMEVPCCRGLPVLVKKALEAADQKIPFKVIVVSPAGEIVNEENW